MHAPTFRPLEIVHIPLVYEGALCFSYSSELFLQACRRCHIVCGGGQSMGTR
jgi:hypothetical protein